MKKRLKVLSLICLVPLCIHSIAFSNVLRGRLEKFGTLGILPASFINVTICKKNGDSIKTVVTGSDGMYSFSDIEPGIYILKIRVKGFENDPLSHIVKILEEINVTDAKTIIIHRFTFELPKEQEFPSINSMRFINEGYRFIAQGSHYALPDDVNIWPVLKCKGGNYLLSTEKPVKIYKNGKWISREIWVDRPVEEILAVLVTEGGDHYFRFLISNNDQAEFHQLPARSYILAKRRIIIH